MKATHAILLTLLATQMAGAAVITVTSTTDSGAGSLRAALASAADGDTIDLTGISGTILLTSGELLVTNSLTIRGPGPTHLAVDGNAASRVFHIGISNAVTISNLTITNGSEYQGGGVYNEFATLTITKCNICGNSGGGILNLATVTIVNSIVSGNNGRGVVNDAGSGLTAVSTVSNCIVSGNTGFGGGGIENSVNISGLAILNVVNSTISGNTNYTSGLDGGAGIYNSGGFSIHAVATIANSTISDNSTTNVGTGAGVGGGGIYNGPGEVTLTDCTVYGNSANGLSSGGGGIFNYGGGIGLNALVTVANSTFSNNSASYGGGIVNNYGGGNASLIIINSTLNDSSIYNENGNIQIGGTIMKAGASDPSIANASGTLTSDGYNLSSDNGGGLLTATGDQINTDPMLGPLQDNGGPTWTMAILPGSPAIDKGKNFSGYSTDQRGYQRTYDNPGVPNAAGGDGTDIGAFEFIPPLLAITPNYGNVMLSWPTNDPGFTAEFTTFLPNSGNWTNVPGTPLVIGNQYVLGDAPVGGNRFYRLRSP